MHTFIKIIGLVIIVLSFAYILKNPKQSLMEALMSKRKKAQEQQEKDVEDSTQN